MVLLLINTADRFLPAYYIRRRFALLTAFATAYANLIYCIRQVVVSLLPAFGGEGDDEVVRVGWEYFATPHNNHYCQLICAIHSHPTRIRSAHLDLPPKSGEVTTRVRNKLDLCKL
ncbi:hypothetical protein Dip518_001164 [Parelusimicrobium proximum]